MRKKTFKNSYSELYLITPEIYHKIMNNLDNKSEKDSTQELNKSEDNSHSVISETRQEEQLLPLTSDLPPTSDITPTETDQNKSNLNNVLNEISDLRKIIENNVFQNRVPTADKSLQTVQNSVSNKQTETDSILKSDGGFQTNALQPMEKGT